jgi:hypothetical protein
MQFRFDDENYSPAVTPVPVVYGFVDSVANDSDKTYTVPSGEMWKLSYANVKLVATATVGNRQVRMAVSNPGGVEIGYISAGAVQAASTTRSYGFMQGIYRETSFIDSMIQVPIPMDLYLPSGSTIRFYDSAAIDAAADDMTVSIGVQRFKGANPEPVVS